MRTFARLRDALRELLPVLHNGTHAVHQHQREVRIARAVHTVPDPCAVLRAKHLGFRHQGCGEVATDDDGRF